MKKVFEDPHYEALTLAEIEKAREAVEKVLTEWNAMKLQHISTPSELYDLVWNHELMVREALAALKLENGANIPGSVPADPYAFTDAVAKAKRYPFAKREHALFKIEKKKTVVTDIEKASELANVRSIYAYNPKQEQFAEDLKTFEEVFNLINAKMAGRLLSVPAFRTAWGQLFNLTPEEYAGDTLKYPVSFKLDLFKQIINQIL